MSKQIVIEYINSNERKHLAENCDEYNKLEDWIDYAKTHIYYHLVVCLESEEIANEEIEEIWNEHHDEEVDLEDDDVDCCKECATPCHTNDLCGHGIGAGKRCVCQKCYDEMDSEEEYEEEEVNDN